LPRSHRIVVTRVSDDATVRSGLPHGAAHMTWSILARDSDGTFGVAIASRFFAVGALCVHTRGATGALATQALMNPLYGAAGIDLLGAGCAPEEVVRRLTESDAGRAQRQVHVIAAEGRPAAHTGEHCVDWCGHQVHDDFSVAGNMLAGAEVLQATADAFVATAGRPLGERLLAAMTAGEAAGGDKRGKQAAALRLHGDDDYPKLDIRVDDHPAPIDELRRLYDKSFERFQPFVACLASRRDPVGLLHRDEIEARVEASLQSRATLPTVPSAAVPEVISK
jgi:uncharacterized Ntn-hydrolase superfamily protein